MKQVTDANKLGLFNQPNNTIQPHVLQVKVHQE